MSRSRFPRISEDNVQQRVVVGQVRRMRKEANSLTQKQQARTTVSPLPRGVLGEVPETREQQGRGIERLPTQLIRMLGQSTTLKMVLEAEVQDCPQHWPPSKVSFG